MQNVIKMYNNNRFLISKSKKYIFKSIKIRQDALKNYGLHKCSKSLMMILKCPLFVIYLSLKSIEISIYILLPIQNLAHFT